MRLRGKIALVTGFGSGLGRAIAILFAREGASVMGTSTTDAKGKETLEVIKRNGGKARYAKRVPLGRIGEADDIARAAVYLTSDEASHVTVAILPVDGGMRLTGS